MKIFYTLPLFLFLVGAGCSRNSSPTPTTTSTPAPPSQTESPTPTSTGIGYTEKNAINVNLQTAGPSVVIDLVVLEKAGFAAIHEDVANSLGPVVGVSPLLRAGEHRNLSVTTTLEGDRTYWAVLHHDNGNRRWDATLDPAATDRMGNVVQMSFQIKGQQPKPPTASNGGSAAPVAQTVQASIQNFAFEPKMIRVKKGDKIIFTNKDGAEHTVSEDEGAFESGLLAKNESFTLDTTFLAVGRYNYYCKPHPFMRGSLLIE